MKYLVTMMVDEDIYDKLRAYSNDRVHIFFANSEEEVKRDIKERLMLGQQQCILDEERIFGDRSKNQSASVKGSGWATQK